jgi:hypothetical protein
MRNQPSDYIDVVDVMPRPVVLPSLSWEEHLVGPDVAGEGGRHTRVVVPLA